MSKRELEKKEEIKRKMEREIENERVCIVRVRKIISEREWEREKYM